MAEYPAGQDLEHHQEEIKKEKFFSIVANDGCNGIVFCGIVSEARLKSLWPNAGCRQRHETPGRHGPLRVYESWYDESLSVLELDDEGTMAVPCFGPEFKDEQLG